MIRERYRLNICTIQLLIWFTPSTSFRHSRDAVLRRNGNITGRADCAMFVMPVLAGAGEFKLGPLAFRALKFDIWHPYPMHQLYSLKTMWKKSICIKHCLLIKRNDEMLVTDFDFP